MLAPGGELYCADAHPSFVALEEHAGRLVPTFDFQTPPDRPLEFVDNRADDLHGPIPPMAHQATRVWDTEKVVSRAAFILLYPAPRGPTRPRRAAPHFALRVACGAIIGSKVCAGSS